jgi:predicted RNA-binding Zn ribbon-like protein
MSAGGSLREFERPRAVSHANNQFETYHPVMQPGRPVSSLPNWSWIGGRPALDFVNTRRDDVECLRSVEDVVVWLVRARLLPQPMKAPASVLAEARALREAIDAGVRAAVARRLPDAGAVALIDGWLALAGSRPALQIDQIGRPVLAERPRAESPRRALGMVAYDAARMLGSEGERARVRICASDTCSARFYDRSPAARRRWCSMALCGNQAKARRFREKSVL